MSQATNRVVYVCCTAYTGKPNSTPRRVQGDKARAEQLHAQWSTKHRYSKTDRYLTN